MKIKRLAISDVLLLTPSKHVDDRGFFSETFRADSLLGAGVSSTFVQDNHVRSQKKGVVRGLHFQDHPHVQGKLIRCIRGRILDVGVDLRAGSPTYAQHVAIELSAENWQQLWIPPGFAHGYATLENDCEVLYKTTDYYAPTADLGIAWNDPLLGINWQVPKDEEILSDRDRKLPRLDQVNYQYSAPR